MVQGRKTCRLAALGVFAALLWLGVPASAQSPLIRTDVTHEPIHLESRAAVQTWETDGVRVFVAAGGGEVRQGSVRLSAPRLVVWFDKNESLRADVRAATVRVYALGTGSPGAEPSVPVSLVEAQQVRKRGVVLMRFRSKLAFSWNCPLQEVEEPASVPLYILAESETKGITVDFERAELPEAVAPELPELISLLPNANERWILPDKERRKFTAVCLGDVRGSYGNVDLTADVAVVWIDREEHSFEAYARGNVILARKPGATVQVGDTAHEFERRFESMRADAVYINPGRERGQANRVEMRLSAQEPGSDQMYVVRGRELYMLNSENLRMREGSFSTCPFAHPHYQFTGAEVTATYQKPTTFLSAWKARLVVGREDTTLFGPVGHLSMGLGREGFALRSIAVGSSNRFGPFVNSSWRLTHLGLDYDWVDRWTLDLGYYGARGPAIGTELDYRFAGQDGAAHYGGVRGYYVHDTGEEDATGLPVPKQDRGQLALRHRSPLGGDWRADVEVNWLSDVGFLREYFQREFEEEKPPESYLMARYRKDSTWFAVVVNKRVNPFLTQLEELPSIELQRVAVPAAGGVYDAAYKIGLYDLEPSDQLVMADPPSLMRVHTDQRVSWPTQIGSVRVDPFLRVLATWASKQALSGGSYSGSQSRFGAGGGVRASIDYGRTYDVFSETLQLNRLRHIVTPYVEFETLPIMSSDSSDFIQLGRFDPWPTGGHGPLVGADRVDAIDKMTQLKLGLRQLLQTKRGEPGDWRTLDWMELDLAYVIRSDDSVAVMHDDNYLEADFDWRLTPNLTIYSHDNRVSTGGGTNVLNAGAALDLPNESLLALDYSYITDIASRLRASLCNMLSDRYGLIIEEGYELGTPGSGGDTNMETHVVLRRFFHDWIFDVGLHYEKSTNQTAFLVGFGPMTGGRWGTSPSGLAYGQR